VAIKSDASNPDIAPTKGDAGGLLKSTLSSCPASAPINEATMTFQRATADPKEAGWSKDEVANDQGQDSGHQRSDDGQQPLAR
jgi:hypothetical protein